jgi:hypothetical protein
LAPILGIPVVVCNVHTIWAILVVSSMQAIRTLQHILELVLRLNTIDPILRIPVVCNMHTIRAIHVVCKRVAHFSVFRGGGALCEFFSPLTITSSVLVATSHSLGPSVQTLASTIVGETFPLLFFQNKILKNPIARYKRK